MPQQEHSVERALREIAELSDPQTAIPVVLKQVRFRKHVIDIAQGLSYPVRLKDETIYHPAIFNTNPTSLEMRLWSAKAEGLKGELETESYALGTFLYSLTTIKDNLPDPKPVDLEQLDNRLRRLYSAPNETNWALNYRAVSDTYAKAWAKGDPNQYNGLVWRFFEQPHIEPLPGTPPLPDSLLVMHARNSALKSVVSLFDTASKIAVHSPVTNVGASIAALALSRKQP